MSEIDIEHLRQWIGRTETRDERIAPFPSNALAATLDRDDPPYIAGSPLPPLWHWMHFLPVFKMRDTNYDGHAALGGFLPPVPLPRRMWAGSRLMFRAPMRIGRELTKVSEVKSVAHKRGRSGDLVFVTVCHKLVDDDVVGVEEEHDIVYREAPKESDPVISPPAAPDQSEFSREITPDPVLLFRYSALTFNGHRIHYDQPFCTTTEGYEGLVVHGPLLATLLLDLLRREKPQETVTNFRFRAVSTVFDTTPFSVHGTRTDNPGEYRLWVRRQDGALAMDATATIGEPR